MPISFGNWTDFLEKYDKEVYMNPCMDDSCICLGDPMNAAVMLSLNLSRILRIDPDKNVSQPKATITYL